jgi:hypothetical protein
MTNPFDPLTFVGLPDWRSALLAVLYTLPWLVILGRGQLRRWQTWATVVVAAVLFPISIAWVQAPLEQGLNLLLSRVLDTAAMQRYLLAVGVPLMAVTGLVQESVKLLIAVAALRLLGVTRRPLAGLAVGAAAGAGYGGFEAFWVFNQVFATGLTWATVQLAGAGALLDFIERLFAVPFHIGATALAGYGYASGRPWRFLLLSIALHSAVNYSIILLQAGLVNVIGLDIWAAVLATATIGLAFWLRRRAARPAVEAPSAKPGT